MDDPAAYRDELYREILRTIASLGKNYATFSATGEREAERYMKWWDRTYGSGNLAAVGTIFRKHVEAVVELWSKARMPTQVPPTPELDGVSLPGQTIRERLLAIFRAQNLRAAEEHLEWLAELVVAADSGAAVADELLGKPDRQVTAKEIAEAVNCSERTLRDWRRRLRGKRNVSYPEFVEAVPPALRSGGRVYSLHRAVRMLLEEKYID